jgi:hypothetical protein
LSRHTALTLAITLLTGSLTAATVASAGPGVNIRWDHCYGDSGVANKSFACDTNLGTERLVLSYELPEDLASVSGTEIIVYFRSAAPAFPDWWQFKNTGSCRQTALSFSMTPPTGSANCLDWSQGAASGGIGAYNSPTFLPAGEVELSAAVAVPPSALQDLVAGTEYFAAMLQISHAKTIGAGACGGCDAPMCIVLGAIKVTTPVLANDIVLLDGANGPASQIASWQSATTLNLVNSCHMACVASFDCVPTSTPTRNSTWGAVKALYR